MSARGHTASAAVTDLLGKAVLKNERFGRHVPFMKAVTDEVIITRQGDLMASLVVDGIDSATSESVEIDETSEIFARIVGQLGEQFGFYVNKVSLPEQIDLARIEDEGFAAVVDHRWQTGLRHLNLKRRVLMLSVFLRPDLTDRLPFWRSAAKRSFDDDIGLRCAELEDVIGNVRSMLPTSSVRQSVSSGEWLALLVATMGYAPARLKANPHDLLCECMTNFDVSFRDNMIVLDDGTAERFGAVFSFKSYPSQTAAAMLDALDLPYDVNVANSFTPRRNNAVLEKMGRLHRQKGASDDLAYSLTDELPIAMDNVASGRDVYGDHHLAVQVFTDSPEELRAASAEIIRALQDTGASPVREKFAARAAYFSSIPGNFNYRFREALVSGQHFADLGALHRVGRGRPHSESPWGTNITVFPTDASTLHRFNFHEQGRVGAEPSVGHTLILGRTGSGKTIGTAFLIAQARRCDARVIVFDKDQGLEMAIRALGGHYSEIKVGKATGLNPFVTETDDRGAAWLIDWLTDVLSRETPLTTLQSVALTEAVNQIVKADPELRTFEGFESLVASTNDGGDLVGRVRQWAQDGRYGWLFAKETTETVAIGEDVLGLDMTELLDLNLERSAVLSYLFRRIERVIEDRRPTIIVIDEAWKMLADDMFVRRLHDWFVTMRKRNCVVMMLTQTPGDLEKSPVGQIIAESVATSILFPNPRANPDDYKIMRVNETEAAFLSSSSTGRVALLRSGSDSVFVRTDLGALGGAVTVLGGGKTGDENAPPNWRSSPGFWKEMI